MKSILIILVTSFLYSKNQAEIIVKFGSVTNEKNTFYNRRISTISRLAVC